MRDFEKIINPTIGEADQYYKGRNYKKAFNTFVKIEYTDGNLSMSGVEGPKSDGNCLGSCGQIYDELITSEPTENWTKEDISKLVGIWKKWHLNDMQPTCEHQRELWDLKKEIELINYTWSDTFYKTRKEAENGKLTTEEYENYQKIASTVESVIFGTNSPKYQTETVKTLLKDGWIKEDKKEIKSARWTTEKEHPEGLLSKPCPVCGYEYGTSWLKMEVPEDVLEWLYNLPDSLLRPAWI